MNTKTKRIKSIKYKTLLYLIFFSVFISVLLWAMLTLFSDYLYRRYQIKDMYRIAEDINKYDGDDIENYFSDVAYKNSVCMMYLDSEGQRIYYNDKTPGCLLGKNKLDMRFYLSKLYENDKDMDSFYIKNTDYDSEALMYVIKRDDGFVFLYTMLINVNNNVRAVRSQMIYMAIVVVFLAIVISIFLSKIISKPILDITKKANSLARGNYNIVFEKNGIREIDELVDSLNYLEAEVSKTDEYRRDLMANVSHDLKTPLTMIKAYAEMIRDISYKDKKKMEEHLNIIIDETDRLNVLVGDILALSKMQANSDVLNSETFSLNDVINNIVKKYEVLKINENYTIEVQIPNDIIVYADKAKINQVIYNLINNAINYTGDDKKVIVKVTDVKRYYLVEIIDSGKGIDPDELDHIWDKYYKNDKNHKRNVLGTGLGLSIVKNILELHNFEYGVNSQKGKGSTFYFKIKKKK